MLLTIGTVTPNQQLRDVCCQFEDIEEAWNFLMSVRQRGDSFLKAALILLSGSYCLPLDELNQGPMENPFEELKRQWDQSLVLPAMPYPNHLEAQLYYQRQLRIHQSAITHNLDVLLLMGSLRASTQSGLPEGDRKTKLMEQCELTIDRCNASLACHNASMNQLRTSEPV